MKHVSLLEATSDPFGERSGCTLRRRVRVLGGVFEFASDSRELMHLVDAAYQGLPAHALGAEPPHFQLELVLSREEHAAAGDEPAPMRMHAGGGLLCGSMAGGTFAVVAPAQRRGLIVVCRTMLRYPYHVRYEVIEFAVYMLAARAQQLVSLHAACVGRNGRGLLLIGPSGAGKSTIALHCLLHGMELLAEDSVLLAPETMLATGIGSFLHLRTGSNHFLEQTSDDAWIRSSPVIQRRSGVEKFEVDLRRARRRLARKPLEIVGVVFLSKQRASTHGEGGAVLRPLRRPQFLEKLQASQPYAANRPEWKVFRRHLARLGAFELLRGRHPREAAEALRQLVG